MSSKSIAVLYSSETGNAEDFATILSHKLRRYHFHHTFCTLGDYNPKDILSCRYLFILSSTTGQGVLPRNARETTNGEVSNTFWSFLKKKQLPSDFLNHVKVGLFGLGDSSYTRFNYAIRKIDKRIVEQLGAIELFPRFEADEVGLAGSNSGSGGGVESTYFEFERLVLSHLLEKYPNRSINGRMVEREAVADEFYLKPQRWLELDDESEYHGGELSFLGDNRVRYGQVITNQRITANDHFQDVRQFVFSMEDYEPYYPGDTVRIYPSNNDANVQAFLETQPHWQDIADKPMRLAGEKGASFVHDGGVVSHLTIRNILKYHCDIMSIPSKSFFMKIWTFATNTNIDGGAEQCQAQRDKLKEFGMDTDMQDLYDYCSRPRRSILEVLADFASVVLPWEYMLDYLPLVKPRYFSISGKPCAKDIELTIAIVKYKTILKRIRKGLCTDYVSGLQKNDTVRYKIQSNCLFSKDMYKSPIIMVSPGVGLAPMMCLIRSGAFGNMSLFFGNRFKDKDFLYAEELLKWEAKNKIKLFTCFSRDRKASPTLKYVQDAIWENGKEVADLIVKRNSIFYLCGSSGKMPIQVRLTISELLKKWGGFPDNETAERYLKDMERSNRYIQETW